MVKQSGGSSLFLVILLIGIIAGYQFITSSGEALAELFGIEKSLFWLILFVLFLFISYFVLGSDSIKKKLIGD